MHLGNFEKIEKSEEILSLLKLSSINIKNNIDYMNHIAKLKFDIDMHNELCQILIITAVETLFENYDLTVKISNLIREAIKDEK
jgi:uncharacterized 2Fe-2S/4Fe-4S cluster protein (DUF4445 family)